MQPPVPCTDPLVRQRTEHFPVYKNAVLTPSSSDSCQTYVDVTAHSDSTNFYRIPKKTHQVSDSDDDFDEVQDTDKFNDKWDECFEERDEQTTLSSCKSMHSYDAIIDLSDWDTIKQDKPRAG